jgi:predicted DNA-binding protein with PD1-like motif
MKTKLLHQQDGQRTFVLVFDTGDEAMAGLQEFARHENLLAATFTAIGAFREVTVAYFDPRQKEYLKIPIGEQVEVLSLIGNVSAAKDQPKVHAHVVLGKRDGTAHGGHLVEAFVRPTLEVVLLESPKHLYRQYDEATGLALINPTA